MGFYCMPQTEKSSLAHNHYETINLNTLVILLRTSSDNNTVFTVYMIFHGTMANYMNYILFVPFGIVHVCMF